MTKAAVPSRLLIVHADDDARTFVRRRFTGLGYEVVEAAEHARALSLLDTNRFDLALVDLQTPGPDGEGGLDLLRQIRQRRAAAELPILAIAAEGAGEDAVEALTLGADDCLLRPLHIDLAHARSEMLIRRRSGSPAPQSAKGELQGRLAALEEAADRTQAVAANLEELGHDVASPINGLLGAAVVLTSICQTPDTKRAIERIEAAAEALDIVMVRALGRADRRSRAPKAKIRVLLADDAADSRFAMRELLHASEVEVEVIEASGGLEAALITDTMFFDLIAVNLASPQAIAGIRAIRRAERQTKTRRTPMLAFGTEAHRADETL
ncbi:response regulator, partial [Phenylobacterium sp.]|uniref:response regulator n=1 Tax=Phenylobacterium sp. TaxID=1871053 RepID=UPI002DF5ABE2|nr:response regulator [Phenylobacterium sp.]